MVFLAMTIAKLLLTTSNAYLAQTVEQLVELQVPQCQSLWFDSQEADAEA